MTKKSIKDVPIFTNNLLGLVSSSVESNLVPVALFTSKIFSEGKERISIRAVSSKHACIKTAVSHSDSNAIERLSLNLQTVMNCRRCWQAMIYSTDK